MSVYRILMTRTKAVTSKRALHLLSSTFLLSEWVSFRQWQKGYLNCQLITAAEGIGGTLKTI